MSKNNFGNFDISTTKSIEGFKDGLRLHLADIYNDCAFRTIPNNTKKYYTNIIVGILSGVFKYTVDFKCFYEDWLYLNPQNLPKSVNYNVKDYISNYSLQPLYNGQEILLRIVGEMEAQERN